MRSRWILSCAVLGLFVLIAWSANERRAEEKKSLADALSSPPRSTDVPLIRTSLAKAPMEIASDGPSRVEGDLESLLASKEGQAIQNAADVSELLNASPESAKLVAIAGQLAELSGACIRAGSCRDARDPARAYYDPAHGHVFRALTNALQLLQAAQTGGAPIHAPKLTELIANLAIPQPEVQLTSLELALGSDKSLDQASWTAILGHQAEIEGTAKPMYFALLQHASPPGLRGAVVDALSRSLAGDEPDTVLEVLRGFDRLALSEREFRKAEQSLCPMIRLRDPSGNSRAAVQYLRRYASSHGFASEPTADCGV